MHPLRLLLSENIPWPRPQRARQRRRLALARLGEVTKKHPPYCKPGHCATVSASRTSWSADPSGGGGKAWHSGGSCLRSRVSPVGSDGPFHQARTRASRNISVDRCKCKPMLLVCCGALACIRNLMCQGSRANDSPRKCRRCRLDVLLPFLTFFTHSWSRTARRGV